MTEEGGAAEPRTLNLLAMSAIALLVGIGTGLGAVGFRALIAFIHNLFFLAQLSFHYDANVFTQPSPWGLLVIAVPVVGALLVTYMVKNYAPEARGHGVPEVMDAIFYNGGAIRPVVVVIKSLASAVSIGTGGSIGREGPIIQIGAALASTAGGLLRIASWQRITLVAAGAGGGIAATFNTPLGAVLFAVELMMPEVSVRTFLPVAIATGTATLIGHIFFGFQPAFMLPPLTPSLRVASIPALVACSVLGLLVGVAGTLFIKAIYGMDDLFTKHVSNPYVRHALGMLGVGLLLYAFVATTGRYYVEGVGYATIQAILDGQMTVLWFLALLFVAKLLTTSLTLGSGGSGGIFSPALFLGATTGAAFGVLVLDIVHIGDISIPAFAMVGMAAMVGSATGAAMTGTIMIFEMTRDYHLVMPMIVAVALSLGVRRLLCTENVYTLKLARRGHPIPTSLHAHMFLVRRAADVMERNVVTVPADTTLDEFTRHYGVDRDSTRDVVVVSGERIAGLLAFDSVLHAVRGAEPGITVGQLVSRDYVLALPDDVMFDVITRMSRRRASSVLVVGGDRRVPRADSALGVITKEHIADSVAESLSFRGEHS